MYIQDWITEENEPQLSAIYDAATVVADNYSDRAERERLIHLVDQLGS